MTNSAPMSVYGISGGPIEKFREGWATIPFIFKPHYWKRRDLERSYDSLCGLAIERTHPGVSPLAPGVFMVERCKHCIRKHQRNAVPQAVAGS